MQDEAAHRRFSKRLRMVEAGLFIQSSEHWEMWESKIYLYNRSYPYHVSSGEKRFTRKLQKSGVIRIPLDIIRHLDLKHNDKIFLAVKKKS